MKIRVGITKTVQEMQFEPFVIALEVEEEVDADITGKWMNLAIKNLEKKVDEVIERRLKLIEEQVKKEKHHDSD